MSKLNRGLLRGPSVLQVNEVTDVAASTVRQYDHPHARCLKIRVTDGFQEAFAIE